MTETHATAPASGPVFNGAAGTVQGATPLEWIVLRAIQSGARLSSVWAYRGFGTCCRLLQKLTRGRDVTILLNRDTAFSFPFADGYWSMLLGGADIYEAEIETFLEGAAGETYTLVDCGANYGYWSALASGPRFGSQRTIAIEPSAATFAVLQNNAAVNGMRFACLRNAVGAGAGTVSLSGQKHEARSVSTNTGGGGETVEMLALDSLLDDGRIAAHDRVVVKLDVEGLEIEALAGGRKLLEGDCIVICEDHGSDRHHSVSRHILETTPLKLFCYDPEAGRFRIVDDAAALDRIKRFRNRGYNVFATASPFWERQLLDRPGRRPRHARRGRRHIRRIYLSGRRLVASVAKGRFLFLL